MHAPNDLSAKTLCSLDDFCANTSHTHTHTHTRGKQSWRISEKSPLLVTDLVWEVSLNTHQWYGDRRTREYGQHNIPPLFENLSFLSSCLHHLLAVNSFLYSKAKDGPGLPASNLQTWSGASNWADSLHFSFSVSVTLRLPQSQPMS